MNQADDDIAASEARNAAPDMAGGNQSSNSRGEKSRLDASFTIVALLLLVIANFACYFRSLNGYFLADDFVHVPWLARVFQGHPELLLQNFVSNWMQTTGTLFYRPLISITLAADYAIWGVNAFGYHLTNLLLQTACSIFLYLTTRRLLRGFQSSISQLAGNAESLRINMVALFAGLLFAVCPLHSEVVSWVIGRVDSVASTFYLCAFWLFLKAEQESSKFWRLAAFASFTLSLLSKEIAITLPASIAFYLFVATPGSLWRRVTAALRSTLTLWLMLFAYIGLRTWALGTVGGGYGGSIGSGLQETLLHRWFGDGSLWRIPYPLNGDVFGHGDKTHRYLRIIYQVGLGVIVARVLLIFSGKIAGSSTEQSTKQTSQSSILSSFTAWFAPVVFASGWFFIAMIPALIVWSLTPTLQGSRFIYLGTAPLCLLVSALMAPIPTFSFKSSVPNLVRTYNLCSKVLLSVLTILFGVIAFKNNDPWVVAGDNVRALQQAVEAKLQHLSGNTKLGLLNLPQQYRGAHMIYNGAMFTVLIQPPLARQDYSDRVATFEPIMFGNAELVSSSRVRRIAGDRNFELFRWDQPNMQLIPISNQQRSADRADLKNLPLSKPSTLSGNAPLILEFPAIKTSDYGFVLIKLRSTVGNSQPVVLGLTWRQEGDESIAAENRTAFAELSDAVGEQTVEIPVGERKSWVGIDHVDKLSLVANGLAAGKTISVESIELVPRKIRVPKLVFSSEKRNSDGAKPVEDLRGVTWVRGAVGPFSYDVSGIPGAEGAVYELSKRDFFFGNKMQDDKFAADVTERGDLKETKAENRELPLRKDLQSGYYDFRIFAVDKTGKIVGYSSDPVDLWIAPPKANKLQINGQNK